MTNIQNTDSIVTTPLRKDALAILQAGLDAVQTKRVIESSVSLVQDRLHILNTEIDLRAFKRIYVIGIGKAAFEAASALEDILGSRIHDGLVLDVQAGNLKHLKSMAGTHPLPSQQNMEATAQIIAMLKNTTQNDLVISIISGGGSALLCWPFELKCNEMIRLTKALMDSGATIEEINTVRKHTSELQGGQLAELADPARVISLIFSDVPGNDIDMVASGPTVLDETTIDDARAVLEKYNILKECELPDCNLAETPKDPTLFAHVTNILVADNTTAVDAMCQKARELGYRPRINSTDIEGEAREIGKTLARSVQPGEALIAGGETTVTLTGKGKGGRNQELALGALQEIDNTTLVLSCASDGIDNSDAAGAIADAQTRAHAQTRSLNPEFFLQENNSYQFFQKTGDHIITGVTGTNVSDLMLALKQP